MLRAEKYIHLRDAIMSNADTAEIGNAIILPSSFVGSPRHMQEYIQDDFRAGVQTTEFICHISM
jgi:hypothetical protein